MVGLGWAVAAGAALLAVPWTVAPSFAAIFGNRPDDLPLLTRLALGTWYPLVAGLGVLVAAFAAARLVRSVGARRLLILAAVAVGLVAAASVLVGFFLPTFGLSTFVESE
jgi:phosphoglycerol transferase MdoB-like AlkP superfamily enzyme